VVVYADQLGTLMLKYLHFQIWSGYHSKIFGRMLSKSTARMWWWHC
jgi:hypothetical protein